MKAMVVVEGKEKSKQAGLLYRIDAVNISSGRSRYVISNFSSRPDSEANLPECHRLIRHREAPPAALAWLVLLCNSIDATST